MKIFISSVQKEFAAERKALAKMIREDRWLGGFFDVFIFEECSAKTKTAQKVYLEAVAESDIYIGLVGDAYGNVDREGVSPTERGRSRTGRGAQVGGASQRARVRGPSQGGRVNGPE